MIVIYRISDAGYNKVKPEYINNENCLKNFVYVFGNRDIQIIADNCSEDTLGMIKKYVHPSKIKKVSVGHGAGTFNLALDEALKLNDNEVVYFVENDYLHKLEADIILCEGIRELGSDYVALYDHPDKYQDGANPYVEGGGEVTKVFLSNSCHWKLTNSTTMTFAAKVKTLKEDEEILRSFTSGTHPNDFHIFLALRDKGRSLITPLPGYATHGETAWLSPLCQWEKI
jgi:hypothetical protein